MRSKAEPAGASVDVREVDMPEFVAANHEYVNNEYIRMFADSSEAELRLYRKVADSSYFKLTIPDVRIRMSVNGETRPDRFNLHYTDVTNLVSWLTALKSERSDTYVRFNYYEDDTSPMIEKAGLKRETLIFRYETSTGRKNMLEIGNVFDVPVNQIAAW